MKFYLVGGAVRDELLQLPIKERDWVVVGGSTDEMKRQGFQLVGKEFPVFLHPKTREEYALARIERKTEPGYKGFAVDASSDVSLAEDLLRRDLTINAMARDQEGNLIDPYGGKKDLANKILKHVSPAFKEDPVRILLVARFMARYQHLGFQIDPSTMELMRDMVANGEVNALVAERVFKELDRALGEPNPEAFFMTLADCGALWILFPGLTIPGKGVTALKAANDISPKAVVRFAALLYQYPECDTNHLSSIKELCRRYRTPVYYQELAELAHKHYQTAFNFLSLSPDELLTFFYALDIFRRMERFVDFLAVIQAIDGKIDVPTLKAKADIVCAVDIKPLLKEGLDGKALGDQIRAIRLLSLS